MPLRFPTAITAAALAALTTAAGAQQVARDDLVGTWSLDGTCASDYGMGLDGDGNVWFEDWGRGLWRFDGDTIHMILRWNFGHRRGGGRGFRSAR
ncbi:MAG: hypothetical protein H6842_09030 [Rhodospirillaceae bacterium]|nr:hypothetical protein [Rhodospirillaceae bacterium]